LIPRSLRWRLLLGAAAAILAALIIAWLLMTLLFERHIERRLAADLTGDGVRIAAAISLSPDGALSIGEPLSDPRLQTPLSGFYWQVSTPNQTLTSRSLWDQTLPRSEAPLDNWRPRIADGPFGQRLFILERSIRPNADDLDVLIQIARDARSLDEARDEFARELALFLTLLWVVLSSAAWFQVELGLRPFRKIRADLYGLRRNPRARLRDADLSELRPLTNAINALADTRETDLDKSKRRAADLAHGLKTPLAALSAQSRRAREAGAIDAADGLDRAIAAIASAVDAELTRTRIAAITGSPGGATLARPTVERLVAVLEHTRKGALTAFDIAIEDQLTLPVAETDLIELLGPLLENAVRYSRRLVRVTASKDAIFVVLRVEDDGPGMEAEQAATAFARGARLDETGPGQGLGLAIARELVEATKGEIHLERSVLGGLGIQLRWPAQTASAPFSN
jgi:signal transduction histidine kinase